jgi:hypothetical protein
MSPANRIIPAVVLINHFAFAPLGFKNKVSVILHMIGDPIDSIWSLLMRHEKWLRLYRDSVDQGIEDREGRAMAPYIATIWSAYEEVGCQDASKFFSDAIKLRGHHVLNGEEIKSIKLASTNLCLNRSDSQFNTLIALAVLLVAMFSAYMRTTELISRIENEVAHTIAVMALLFFLLPLVLINGITGSFTLALVPVEEIRKLRLKVHTLFPPLDLGAQENPDELHETVMAWPRATSWGG